MPLPLIIAPDVVQLLGGELATRAAFADAAGPFRCAVCGNAGRLDADHSAAVVVVVDDGGTGPRDVQFAHPGCSESRVQVTGGGAPDVPSTVFPDGLVSAWLRPADTDPPAVLVIAHQTYPKSAQQPPDRDRLLLSRLLAYGFGLLTDPDTPLPQVPGLTAWHTDGRLVIQDIHWGVVWNGSFPTSHAWTYAALRAGRLGVVVTAADHLSEPGQARGLYTAITSGRAAGAAIQLSSPTTAATRRKRSHARSTNDTQFRALVNHNHGYQAASQAWQ